MQFICPACRTPLPKTPPGTPGVLTCGACSAEVDVSRAGTAAGRPRFVPEIDRSGDVVAGWTLQERIGMGGMGTVYRATREGRAVAIKFLSTSLAAEADVVARFRREIRLLEKLDHPAIVRVLEHGEEDGVPWFAMELVDGPDLRARLAKGPLSVEEVAKIFARLLDALAHAHDRGVVHRDLKPANVLLAHDGARLADFGIARPDPGVGTGATRLTETAAILGTFPYMSPEQRAGADVDRRSDLFSVGVMLYESLVGAVPQGAFTPPSQSLPGIPYRIDNVVAKLMRPRADQRHLDARDAALEVAAALRPRPSLMPVAAGGAVVLVLLALIGGTMWPGAGTKPDTTKFDAQVASNAQSIAPQNAELGNANQAPQDNVLGNTFAGNTKVEKFPTKSGKPLPPEKLRNAEGDDATGAKLQTQRLDNALADQPVVQQAAFVKQMEAGAKTKSGTRISLTCDPTSVYTDPSFESSVLGTVPSGSRVEKLKEWRKLAFLNMLGLGRGAGIPALMSAPPSKAKPVSKSELSEAAPQQGQANRSIPPAAKNADAPIPHTWFFVRVSETLSGWIDSVCAVNAPVEPKKSSSSGLDVKK